MLTWGDGVSDVNLKELLAFHKAHGKLATVTAVRPPARFGCMVFEGDRVKEFSEKPQTTEGWINGAFFVLEPQVFEYIEGDNTPLGKRADGEARPRRAVDGVSPHEFLAVHGHDPRQAPARRFVGIGQAPWASWLNGKKYEMRMQNELILHSHTDGTENKL